MQNDRAVFAILYKMKSCEVMYLRACTLENQQNEKKATGNFAHIMKRIGTLHDTCVLHVRLNGIAIVAYIKVRSTDMKQNPIALEDGLLHIIPDEIENDFCRRACYHGPAWPKWRNVARCQD